MGILATVLLDHGQVLVVRVSGEEQLARVQLAHNAADRPDVTDLVPLAALQDNLGRPILPCVDYGTVILVVSGRSPKINDTYFVSARQIVFVTVRELLVRGLIVIL